MLWIEIPCGPALPQQREHCATVRAAAVFGGTVKRSTRADLHNFRSGLRHRCLSSTASCMGGKRRASGEARLLRSGTIGLTVQSTR